jgi:hypothetical protein
MNGGASRAGAVYVFEEPETGWSGTLTETQRLTAADATTDDHFGSAVALADGALVVGAYRALSPLGGSGVAYLFADEAIHPLLDIAYTYYANDGSSGSDSFHLYSDGAFTTDTDATGTWSYLPAHGVVLLRFEAGHFCDALFLGRVQETTTMRGLYDCQDGSGVRGVWVGALSLPLDALPEMPVGDGSLVAPEGMLRELEK